MNEDEDYLICIENEKENLQRYIKDFLQRYCLVIEMISYLLFLLCKWRNKRTL